MSIRKQLDKIVKETNSYDATKTPQKLIKDLNSWKWGSYGWISPASLIFTAAWRKHFYPDMDCCKIWAVDESNNPIEGSYSIRTEDETITIPILAKYDLCNGFCSSNSGMQGSRAIEKMRAMKRLGTDFDTTQRTVFDLKLFASLLNQINDLSSIHALEVLKYLIVIAKGIKKKRDETNAALNEGVPSHFKLTNFLSETADPELTKCVVAACLDAIYSQSGLRLDGISDYKTAADARAQKPGDLSLSKDGSPLVAVEVKDKSQTIDWNNIERAVKIIDTHSCLISFLFVLENRYATVNNTIQDMIKDPSFSLGTRGKISFISLHDLFLMALVSSSEQAIGSKVGEYLSLAPAVKPETKSKFVSLMK